jgi:hypothetical protein
VLAKLVIDRVPSVEMVRFVSSGTEACLSVLRLMRAYTKREKIIKFVGCYHGHADSFLVKAGSGVATLGLPDSPGKMECLQDCAMHQLCPVSSHHSHLPQILLTFRSSPSHDCLHEQTAHLQSCKHLLPLCYQAPDISLLFLDGYAMACQVYLPAQQQQP